MLSRVRVEDGWIAFDAYGRVFAADDAGVASFSKARARGRALLRLRRAHGGLEKTGSHQVFWNVDPPEGHTASFNNLYTSIPFVLSLVDGRAHGLFLDYPGRVEFDLAKADPDRFTAVSGDAFVYYVFAGPTPRDVLPQYTELTGRISLPPLWALGNQQSRWGYEDADEVRAIARGYRERDIPCDVLYLDIDHMDGYRVFTFDAERFPDPAGFVAELEGDGFKVVCITDPGVKVDEDYGVYVAGRERDLYCKTKRGTEYRNVVWPGLCAFPDFTNPEAREWWGDQQAPLVEAGVAGVWCDMDEPALFVPRPVDDAPRRRPSGRRRAALPPGRPQPLRLADGAGGARGLGTAAAGQAPVRDHPRGLRRPAARRAPVDGRQLVLVGAPVDEHAPAAEPRPVGRELLRRRRRRLLRRLQRRAAGALDRVRDLPAVLPQPLRARAPCRRSRGRSASRGRRSVATCCR